MPKFIPQALLALCLCLLTGCASADAPVSSAPETIPAAVTEAAPAPVQTLPETQAPEPESTEAAPEETLEEAGVLPEDAHDPVLAPPEAEEGPCHFFDDAAFIGDSISHTLMLHHTKTGDFGDAIFFVRGSLGVHNTQNKQLTVFYQGQSLTPWEALAASGVNKVFIMLGMNDIGYYGIDDTMEKWETFLAHIRESCPDIQVYIQAQTPMWSKGKKGLLTSENIDLYNQRLQEFAEENDCHFLDVTPYLKDSTNSLAKPYCSDFYVHMNYEGTAVWADFLKNYGAQQEKENP